MPDAELSKYLEVARRLEADVRAGQWDGGRLPSVRKVASSYGVSVVTASRALQVLRDKGLIRTVERSGCYRVPPPDADHWAIVLRLTPGPMIGLTTSLVRDGFARRARVEPMHLHFDSFDLHDGLTVREAADAAHAALANGLRGVVLLPSRSRDESIAADRAFAAGCREAGMPLVLFERGLAGPAADAGFDLVAIDDVTATATAVRHAQRTGCRAIACVTASDVSSHRDRVAGYLLGLQRANAKSKPIVLTQDNDLSSAEAYADLANRVVKAKADAVVCYSDYVAAGIMVELQKRGIDIPRDVSVIGFDNLLIGEQFPVPLSTIGYSTAAMAEWAVHLLRARIAEPDRPTVRVAVPGEWIVRASTREESV
jgi:LacI family transcriptional regulator